MPIWGSRPGSAPPSQASSRASSPGPAGKLSKTDSLRIDGNLYDILRPPEGPTQAGELLPKELHVVLRYVVSFVLSKPVHCESIRTTYRCTMIVTTDPGDGQFREAEIEEVELCHLNWTIWRGTVLEAGREYSFEFNGELPPQTPRSLKTPHGRIEHTMTVRLDGVKDSGRLRRTRKTIEVWNPFSMDADNPRPGLEFHGELDQEMVGTSVEIDKDLVAFIRYPDQCYKGTPDTVDSFDAGIGRSFPCEISFPAASESQLHSISHVDVDILQTVWFLNPTRNKVKPVLLSKDVYPITATAIAQPSTEPQRVTLPLPDPIIHGRFTSDHLRVRHELRAVFHRKWFGKKFEWREEVEIFHRDVGWETRGEQGILEIVRGQEGDYFQSPPGLPTARVPPAADES
jgi:hypothetical protein